MVNIGDIALASRVSLDAIMDEYYYVGSVNTGDDHSGIQLQWDRQGDDVRRAGVLTDNGV